MFCVVFTFSSVLFAIPKLQRLLRTKSPSSFLFQAGNWVLVLSLAAAIFIVIARLCLWNTQAHEWEVTERPGSFFNDSPAPSQTLIPPNNSDTEETTCFNAIDTNAFINQSFTSPKDLTERYAAAPADEEPDPPISTRRCNTL